MKIYLYIKILLSILCSINFINAQDSLALVAIYNSTDGYHWVNNENWLTNTPISQWFGIQAVGLKVEKIDLSLNHLSGNLPPEFWTLANVSSVNLQNNQLAGIIPDTISGLKKVQILNLSYNQLSDRIPASIGFLTNLSEIDLSNNQFTGAIPPEIGALTSLQYLDLSYNRLDSDIPSEIGKLLNLKINLNLRNNFLNGPIPKTIGNLRQLESLDLSNNILSGSIPAQIGKLTKLKDRLALQHNKLEGTIPFQLFNLINLRHLWLNDNNLEGSIPRSIGQLKNLESLYLYDNSLSGNIPMVMSELTKLEYLYIQKNAFKGEISGWLPKLSSIVQAKMNNNNFTGNFPRDLRFLKSVKRLDLQNNQLNTFPDTLFIDTHRLIINLKNNVITKLNSSEDFSRPFTSQNINILGLNSQENSANREILIKINKLMIDFGIIMTGTVQMDSFTIHNSSSEEIMVKMENLENEIFQLNKNAIMLDPGQQQSVTVSFIPDSNLAYYDDLTVSSDSMNFQQKINLLGGAVNEIDMPGFSYGRAKYSLYQNYPEPFSNSTTIRFDLPNAAEVNLSIFNKNGKIINVLADKYFQIGKYSITWDGQNLEGDMVEPDEYFYLIRANSFMQIRKMTMKKSHLSEKLDG